MSLVIVTNRCFLICEKVTSIIIQEHISENRYKRRLLKTTKKTKVIKQPTRYTIVIAYLPESSTTSKTTGFGSGSNREEHQIELDVFGKAETFALYSEIVEEIRGQNPDELYLDKLVEKMLNSSLEIKDPNATI